MFWSNAKIMEEKHLCGKDVSLTKVMENRVTEECLVTFNTKWSNGESAAVKVAGSASLCPTVPEPVKRLNSFD